MAFYELSKLERVGVVKSLSADILRGMLSGEMASWLPFFADDDTYIRKSAYLACGKLFQTHPEIRDVMIKNLGLAMQMMDFKIRQTTINTAGEIGKTNFPIVSHFFDFGLFDVHHSVRNAVIGSVKKMGELNPKPVLAWAANYLHHSDKEIRREICHGIELRGRKHPEDILPLLKQLQFDSTSRVRNTLVHVLGQIAYKKGCLAVVINELKSWENRDLVEEALTEIIDVHHRYRNFAALTQEEAVNHIQMYFPEAKYLEELK